MFLRTDKKLQGKAVFQFLCDAVTALRNEKTVPSLAWAVNGYKKHFSHSCPHSFLFFR
jgi:hypothetical protein